MDTRSPQLLKGLEPPPTTPDPLALLAQTLDTDEARLDLGWAALVIAVAHYPYLSLETYRTRLDTLAAEAERRLASASSPEYLISTLNTYLFQELGFRGNTEDYYNPANSFLNEVLDTQQGLPISLSILYLSLAHRLHLPIAGVGMPLHFLVKYVDTEREILIDPFYGGQILTPTECQDRVERIAGQPIVFDPAYLAATPKRVILYRLLNNLKQVYLRRQQPGSAGRVIEQMLVVMPQSASDVRDRGMLLLQEHAYSRGIGWLSRYLAMAPHASDAAEIRNLIGRAHERRALLN